MTILQKKILIGDFQSHAPWNSDLVDAVHITWVVIWIMRAFQCIVKNGATTCEMKSTILKGAVSPQLSKFQR